MNNSLKSAFDQIHAEPELKTHTMDYLSENVYGRKKHKNLVFIRAAAAAACFLFFLCGGGYYMYFTPTAYISIDINPSLELEINRFNRIISVEGYNDDGTELASSLNIRFMDYQDGIDCLLSDETVEAYLSGDAVMSLTVAGKYDSQSNTILDNVESCVSDHENVYCHSGDISEMHDAHESGMSFGKYQAYLRLRELDPSVTEETVKNLTMREIMDLIKEYSGDSTEGTESGNEQNTCENSSSSDTESGNNHNRNRAHENGHGQNH